MSEWLSQISDFLTTKYPEIIAILTSSAFVWWLTKFLCSLIIIKIQNKTKDKFSKPIADEFKALRDENTLLKIEIKEMLTKHSLDTKENIKLALEQEANKKKLAYEQIMNEQVPVIEQPIEQPVVVEEVVEEVVEPVVEEKPKTEFKVAKRVIDEQ